MRDEGDGEYSPDDRALCVTYMELRPPARSFFSGTLNALVDSRNVGTDIVDLTARSSGTSRMMHSLLRFDSYGWKDSQSQPLFVGLGFGDCCDLQGLPDRACCHIRVFDKCLCRVHSTKMILMCLLIDSVEGSHALTSLAASKAGNERLVSESRVDHDLLWLMTPAHNIDIISKRKCVMAEKRNGSTSSECKETDFSCGGGLVGGGGVREEGWIRTFGVETLVLSTCPLTACCQVGKSIVSGCVIARPSSVLDEAEAA